MGAPCSVADLLETEKAVVDFSASQIEMPDMALPEILSGEPTVQILTEGKIRDALLSAFGRAGQGDQVDVAVFYLSDRGIIDAIADAHDRGAQVHLDAVRNRPDPAAGMTPPTGPLRPYLRKTPTSSSSADQRNWSTGRTLSSR